MKTYYYNAENNLLRITNDDPCAVKAGLGLINYFVKVYDFGWDDPDSTGWGDIALPTVLYPLFPIDDERISKYLDWDKYVETEGYKDCDLMVCSGTMKRFLRRA